MCRAFRASRDCLESKSRSAGAASGIAWAIVSPKPPAEAQLLPRRGRSEMQQVQPAGPRVAFLALLHTAFAAGKHGLHGVSNTCLFLALKHGGAGHRKSQASQLNASVSFWMPPFSRRLAGDCQHFEHLNSFNFVLGVDGGGASCRCAVKQDFHGIHEVLVARCAVARGFPRCCQMRRRPRLPQQCHGSSCAPGSRIAAGSQGGLAAVLFLIRGSFSFGNSRQC